LAALFKDPEGDAPASVGVAAQPEGSRGAVTALESGGLQFLPRYKATGQSVFLVAAKDAAGASGGSIPIKVDVLGAEGMSRGQEGCRMAAVHHTTSWLDQ
jgi:hypothetical protein